MNTIQNYGMTNYQLNNKVMFKANKNVNGIYKRSADKVEKIISNAKERLDGRDKFTITEGLCDMVGKCLGGKYLFELVGTGKEPELWLAINKDTVKAMDVVENILKAKESQGKTYNEIVDTMIAELKPKKQEFTDSSDALRSTITPQINYRNGSDAKDGTGRALKLPNMDEIAAAHALRKKGGLDDVTNNYITAHQVKSGLLDVVKDNASALIGKLASRFSKSEEPVITRLTPINRLKTSLKTENLTDLQIRLIEEAKIALKDNKNVNLYTHNIGWGSYINPSSNPDMFLHVKSEDFHKMTDVTETMLRMSGGDGIFELSILGSDKKAKIIVPAKELTRNMEIIDTSMQAGIHPFLIDMAKYLDKHPEAIKDIEANVGKIDLAGIDSSIAEKINACK